MHFITGRARIVGTEIVKLPVLTELCSLIVGREPVLWSEEAWDLMQRLLAPAHSVRPSATIALQHQYFIPHYDKPQRALTQ